MCVCVLVLKCETSEVNTQLVHLNELRECRELDFSRCDVRVGERGNRVFL